MAKKAEKNVTNTGFDLNALVQKEEKVAKSTLSFNKRKDVDLALTALAESKGKKPGTALNDILKGIIDTENKCCKVAIEEERIEKVQHSYKIDKDLMEVIKKESDSRDMSINEYLNKVMVKLFDIK